MLYTFCNKMMYVWRQKVPIYRPYNGMGNIVQFPFHSRLISGICRSCPFSDRSHFVPRAAVRSSEWP